MQKSDNNVKNAKSVTMNSTPFSIASSGKTHIIGAIKALENDDLTILVDESLAKYSTMRVGGVARVVALPKTFGAFLRVFECARALNMPYYILGNGSNTLCSSKGFDGVVICTKNMNKISFLALLHTPARKAQKCIFQSKKESATNAKHSKIANNNINISETNVHIGQNCAQNGNAKGKKNNTAYKKNANFQNSPRKGLLKNATLTVFAECGARLPLMSKRVCGLGFRGLEFACGIPATCGGAVKMNAGAFGGQMVDVVWRVLIFNTDTRAVYYKYNEKMMKNHSFCVQNYKKGAKKYKSSVQNYKKSVQNCKNNSQKHKNGVQNYKKDLNNYKNRVQSNKKSSFARKNCVVAHKFCAKQRIQTLCAPCKIRQLYKTEYRKTNIADNEFIIGAQFIFSRGNRAEIAKKCAKNTNARRATQSVGYPSLGSVFKRMDGFIPSAFIDKSGLKGLTLGGAQVSKVHAGYIVNRENATSDDILKLLKFLQNYICKNLNIVLQYELKFLGEHNEKE